MREELHPLGLEVVTVALDVGGAEDAGRWIDAADAKHPSLIDSTHVLDELFGVVNVPSGIWIDEQGMIVRPPEPSWPGKSAFREVMGTIELPPDADPYVVRALGVTSRINVDPEGSLARLRDWARNGAASEYAMSPGEVISASRARGPEQSRAAAHFELGQHLWRAESHQVAIEHFKRAHALAPENWTYKRQAWQFASPILQNATEVYGTDWATEVEQAGPENYYPPL